jgi:hypothetical protein
LRGTIRGRIRCPRRVLALATAAFPHDVESIHDHRNLPRHGGERLDR